jgi:hypothetical protein
MSSVNTGKQQMLLSLTVSLVLGWKDWSSQWPDVFRKYEVVWAWGTGTGKPRMGTLVEDTIRSLMEAAHWCPGSLIKYNEGCPLYSSYVFGNMSLVASQSMHTCSRLSVLNIHGSWCTAWTWHIKYKSEKLTVQFTVLKSSPIFISTSQPLGSPTPAGSTCFALFNQVDTVISISIVWNLHQFHLLESDRWCIYI